MKEKDYIKKMFNTMLKGRNLRFVTLAFSVLLSFLLENIDVVAKSDVDAEKNSSIINSSEDNSSLSLTITDEFDGSFSWIEINPNLEDLTIIIDTYDTNKLREIENISKLTNLKSLSLITKNNFSLSNDEYSFLKDCPSLRSLDIEGFSIEKGLLESLTNLDELSLSVFDKENNNIDTDYSKLTFLNTLNFKDSKPYNIAIWFTLQDYDTLIDNNVSIVSEIDGCLDKVKDLIILLLV